jgi:hypothetical protein
MTTRAQELCLHALIATSAAVGAAWWLDRRAQCRHVDALAEGRQERGEWLGVLDEVGLNGDALRRTMVELSKNVSGLVELLAKADTAGWRTGRDIKEEKRGVVP